MVENKQYLLIVVSVQSGRFFPKRNRWKISIEAKFDGEHLATDPVDHIDTPEIGTELAWEIDKKSLRQHRLNRTPIKLQVYAIESHSLQKELIGLIMIDLKKADQKPMQSQWYPILNCSYSNSRPELKVGIMLETDNNTNKAAPKNVPASLTQGKPSEAAVAVDGGGARRSQESPTISLTDKDYSSSHKHQHQNPSLMDQRPLSAASYLPNNQHPHFSNQFNQQPQTSLLNPELCQMIHNLVNSSSSKLRNQSQQPHHQQHQSSSDLPNGADSEQPQKREKVVNFQTEQQNIGSDGGGGVMFEDTSDLRATSEYQIALELQLWKEQQQQLFINQMKVKEMERMKTLSEEWKRRDMERELITKQKMEEASHLEDKLQKAILQIEKREKLLAKNEAQLEQQKTEIVREYEKKNSELNDACARIEKDCVHKIELEKEKRKFVEEELSKVKNDLLSMEKKLKEKDREFEQFKQQLDLKPEVRLQANLNVLSLEKVELERKLESVTASKAHYKQEWGRALKELFKLKQTIQSQQEMELKKEKQQLEHMRLVHMAAEERKLANSEKGEIEQLKEEIHRLKDFQSSKSNKLESGDKSTTPDFFNQSNDELESHVTRLIEERDTLLRTGVYNSGDKIIADLDKQIREAIAAKVS